MIQPTLKRPEFQHEYMQHAEELLFHTSRYYAYTEHFLAELAGETDFSMTGYHCSGLSRDQRKLLAALMMEPPGEENARIITRIVTDVITGIRDVDSCLMQRFSDHIPSGAYILHHYFGGHGFQLDTLNSPAGPIENLARRLMIPIEIEDHTVKLSFHEFAHYFDSSNPVIRQNVKESVQQLYAGAFKLKNVTSKRHWNLPYLWNTLRITLQLLHWRLDNEIVPQERLHTVNQTTA